MMVYWVFTEEQLDRAMRDYIARNARVLVTTPDSLAQVVGDFLRSPEALQHKLRVEDKSRG